MDGNECVKMSEMSFFVPGVAKCQKIDKSTKKSESGIKYVRN